MRVWLAGSQQRSNGVRLNFGHHLFHDSIRLFGIGFVGIVVDVAQFAGNFPLPSEYILWMASLPLKASRLLAVSKPVLET